MIKSLVRLVKLVIIMLAIQGVLFASLYNGQDTAVKASDINNKLLSIAQVSNFSSNTVESHESESDHGGYLG